MPGRTGIKTLVIKPRMNIESPLNKRLVEIVTK